jgi:hypothetical protein
MRILNNFNSEIKTYQQQNIQKIYIDIFGLTMTLEKPTRGKPVREGFLLFESFRENSFTSDFSFRKYTNLSQKFLLQNYFRTTTKCSLISVPKNCIVVRPPQH